MASRFKPATSAAALSVFLVSTPVFADVTPEDVWADWQAYMVSSGYDITARESRSSDTLSLEDLAMTMAIPEEDVTIGMTITELSFTDNGDGTVSVSLPASMPLRMSVVSPEGEAGEFVLDYTSKGFAMNVSGDPSSMVYNYSAAEIGVALAEIMAEGQSVDIGTIAMTVANMTGTTEMTTGTIRTSKQKMTTGAVVYAIDVADPEGDEGSVIFNGGVGSMDFNGTATLPEVMDVTNMGAMLAAGFGFDGGFSYQNGQSEFTIKGDGQTVEGSTSSTSGGIEVAMDGSRLTYAGNSMGMQIAMAGGDIPFPVEIGMEKASFNISMPVVAGEASQDFAFGVTLGNFVMSDMIWGLVDPLEKLPRDPATIALDLTGKAKLFLDLMDPEQMEKVDSGEVIPGELNELSINNLVVSAVGASLTGAGGFTFDNTDMSTFDGIPAPTGSVDLSLVGANGLIDKLIEMGMLPEDQAMGARMMMGLFAVPGNGEDTLVSTIEVKGDGQVLANGQRLK